MDMVNCLICFKEVSHRNRLSNPNPNLMICKTLSNLFSTLNNFDELFYVKNETKLINFRLCTNCSKCIDQVQDTLKELQAVQKRLTEFRQKIQNEFIEGYKKSLQENDPLSSVSVSSSFESFQLRKSIVQNIAPSIVDQDQNADYNEPNAANEDFNNFDDFDDDLPILYPYSTFDDLNLNLNDIKPTFGSLWNLKPLQIILTRCDEKINNNGKVEINGNGNIKSVNTPFKRRLKISRSILTTKCDLCNIQFKRREYYLKHMMNKHEIGNYVKTTDDLNGSETESDDLPDDDTHMSYFTFMKIVNCPSGVTKCPKSKCPKQYIGDKYDRKRKLLRHLRSVHSIQIKLKKEKSTSNKYAKYYKIEKVNGIDQVTCPLCPVIFVGKGVSCRINRHLNTVHNPNNSKKRINKTQPRGEFACGRCKANFSKKSYLERHQCLPERISLLKSSVSDQDQLNVNENTTLLQLDGKNVPDKIKCDQCGKLFEGKGVKGRIRYHLLRIHNIDTRPKKTPIEKEKGPLFCNYPDCASAKFKIDFISLGRLARHMKSHGEILQLDHQCDKCVCSFASPSLLRGHQRKVHEVIPKNETFICDICAKVFDKRYSLNIHQTAVHQLKFACKVPNCNKIFTQRINFEYHQRSFHGIGEKLKYQCDHENCNYSANRRANYEIHISKHIEVRNFKCTLCDVVLKTNFGLKKHMFNCHTHPESAKKQCPECEMSFLFKRELENHLIVRHGIGEKTKCTYCPRTFAIRRYMRNHVKKDHPNEDQAVLELKKRWVPLEMLEAPLEVQKELITNMTTVENCKKESQEEQKRIIASHKPTYDT